MYHATTKPWRHVLNYHAACLLEIERGNLKWGDNFQLCGVGNMTLYGTGSHSGSVRRDQNLESKQHNCEGVSLGRYGGLYCWFSIPARQAGLVRERWWNRGHSWFRRLEEEVEEEERGWEWDLEEEGDQLWLGNKPGETSLYTPRNRCRCVSADERFHLEVWSVVSCVDIGVVWLIMVWSLTI